MGQWSTHSAGDMLGQGEALLEKIRGHLRQAQSVAALDCLDKLIRYARAFHVQDYSQQEVRRCLNLIRCIQGLSMYLGMRGEEALDLLPTAREAARLLGDRRTPLVLDLLEASHRHITASHNAEPPRALLERTRMAMQVLGDTDIQAATMHTVGMLHFLQADFPEAVRCLRQGASSNFLSQFDYFEESRWRYIASAACGLGQDDLGFGVLLGAMREAKLDGRPLAARWFQMHLAGALLCMGKPHEALEHLDDVLQCCNPTAETRLWNWAMRCLAYYHFQLGRITTAHRILHHCMDESLRRGLRRAYYDVSWLFDMLWAFNREGLPPIPGYALHQEMQAASQGANRLLQAAALRLRAVQEKTQGVPTHVVTALSTRAVEQAESVGNPLEKARAQRILARSLYAEGRQDQARLLYKEACDILTRYTQHDAPQSPGQQAPAPYIPPPRECLALLQKRLENPPTWDNLDEHWADLLLIVRDCLEVERTALFRRQGDERQILHCAAACHISAQEIHNEAFADHRSHLLAHAGTAPTLRQGQDGATLCVTLPQILQQEEWLLFLHCHYLPERLELQQNEVFIEAAHLLGTAMRAALTLEEQLRQARQQAEKRARIIATRIQEGQEPHHGLTMQGLMRKVEQVACTDAAVLILGETGVGKEMLARQIHDLSRRSGPFVAVHTASIPEHLLESELMGHEKGAFLEAQRQQVGLFELAHEGTLFIDELGDIPLSIQGKFLRVLQEKACLRLGGTREVPAHFRLISATSRDLALMAHDNAFRADLYQRVATTPLQIPALRDRPEDILPLARLFLERVARRCQRELPYLLPEDESQLLTYPWPGNIRELKSVMERSLILSHEAHLNLTLGNGIAEKAVTQAAPGQGSPAPAQIVQTDPAEFLQDWPNLEELQVRYMREVLQRTRGKIDGPEGAAKILGMKRSTLYAKIRQYKLDSASLAYGK